MSKKTESRSKVLSLILALAMMITTLVPVVAGASGGTEEPVVPNGLKLLSFINYLCLINS